MSKDFQIKKERINRKLERYMKCEGLEFYNLNKENLDKFIIEEFQCINRSSFYPNVKALNEILEENCIDIQIKSKDYVDKCVQPKDEKYFTRREIQEICDIFINSQDQFIIYALWNGIMGKNYEDLLSIKVSDVAEDYSYINLPNGKRFICDEFMQEILLGVVNHMEYMKYLSVEEMRSADTFEFNPECEYLIKTMRTKRNNDGLNKMLPSTLQRRLDLLAKIYMEGNGEKIGFSGKSLVKSGVMYNMFLKEDIEGKSWGVEEVSNYLKINGYKINANELYRVYHNVYHGSHVNQY